MQIQDSWQWKLSRATSPPAATLAMVVGALALLGMISHGIAEVGYQVVVFSGHRLHMMYLKISIVVNHRLGSSLQVQAIG